MAAAAGTAAVPSAAALEATGRRARDPRVRAGGSRARTVHRPTWLGLGMAACRTQPPNRAHQPHPSRTRPTARVCSGHGRSVRSRARTCRARRPSGEAVLQQRRVPGPRTVRRSSYNTGGCTPGSARHRDGHPQPCCTPVTSAHTRTLAHSCGTGCALVWAMRWGDARVVDASGLRSGAMHGPRARTATVAEAVLDPGGPAAARSSPRRGAARRCRKFW